MDIKIETGIPLPPVHQKTGLVSALCAMRVGESLQTSTGNRALCARASLIANDGRKFTTRKTSQGVVRIWRIA